MKRRGMTLIEVLVAITVLSVAVLAYTGAVASVSRSLGWEAVRARAAVMTESALEQARLAGCGQGGTGASSSGRVSVLWRASAGPSRTDIAVITQWTARPGATVRADTFLSAVPCP